ncbi:MAG: hypothetical protein J7M25_00765 [Deltaproteobacteria bacterium]|nr:hypothetical protein [Deltaproteobacteria bacterium]
MTKVAPPRTAARWRHALTLIAAFSLMLVWNGCGRHKASDTKTDKATSSSTGGTSKPVSRAAAENMAAPRPRQGARPARPSARLDSGRLTREAEWEAMDPRDSRAVYRVRFNGQVVGRLVAEERYHASQMTTSVRASFKLLRAGTQIKIASSELYNEKLDGTPVSFRILFDQGASKIKMSGVYQNGFMVVDDGSGTKQKVKYDKRWLFPGAESRMARKAGYRHKGTTTYLKFQPQMGLKGVTVTRQILGDGTATFKGKTVHCHKIRVTAAQFPPQDACVDDRGMAYNMTFAMGIVTMHMDLIEKNDPTKDPDK